VHVNRSLLKAPDLKLLADAAKPLRVLIAYDDSIAHRQAVKLYLLLAERFQDLQFICDCWSFDQLSQRLIAQKAARAAAAADMIILGITAAQLPKHVPSWIESWLSRKGDHNLALVALLGTRDGLEPAFASADGYLQNLGRRGCLTYLANYFQVSRAPVYATIEALQTRSGSITPDLGEIFQPRPPVRWGINE
jgi:hypothetical protein